MAIYRLFEAPELVAPTFVVALDGWVDAGGAATAAAGLLAEGIDVRGLRPRRVTREDLAQAWKVVSFGPDLADLLPAGRAVLRWDDVPAVSDGFDAARAAITRRLAEVWS